MRGCDRTFSDRRQLAIELSKGKPHGYNPTCFFGPLCVTVVRDRTLLHR